MRSMFVDRLKISQLFKGFTLLFGISVLFLCQGVHAQNGPIKPPPITLGPGDTAVFTPPPADYETRKENIRHGKVDSVQYFSKTVGNNRKLLIYTPPGYNKHKKYPVLFLLHGIGGDEKEWFHYGAAPDAILDNLLAQGKVVPMIVVFPNGRAQPDDRPIGNVYAAAPAFEKFGKDLLNDIIPFVEANYPVRKDSKGRALAGFSMGGGQTFNFGLTNPDTFAWIGAFSSAPNTKKAAELVPNPQEFAKKMKLIYLSCGDKDGLIFISQGMNNYLNDHHVPHIWQVEHGGHSMEVWTNSLYHFAQLVFK